MAATNFSASLIDSAASSVVTALRANGIPFVLASGGHVDPPPAEFADVALIEKPYTIDRVSPIIAAALAEAEI